VKRFVPLLCLLATCLVSTSLDAFAQDYVSATGTPSFAVNIPVENGFINLTNGNLHLEFPLATHPQRGALSLNERLVYDSKIWMIGNYSNYYWWPNNIPNTLNTQGGWRFITGAETGAISATLTSNSEGYCEYQTGSQFYNRSEYFTWTDPSGTSHKFNAAWSQSHSDCTPSDVQSQTISGYATDASGYNIELVGPNDGEPTSLIVRDNSGTQVYPQVIDRYGNFWSKDAGVNLIDDTGRIPVITTINGNVTYYDVLSPGGPINDRGTRVRYTVTTAPVQVQTAFRQVVNPSSPNVYVGEWTGTLYPIQSIQLPDGSSYTFTYDGKATSGDQAQHYGELTSVTLPTGGKIGYGWANYLDSYQNENRWLYKRQVGSDSPTVFTPSVVSYCSSGGTGCQQKVNVHKPSGDESVYTLTMNNGAWNTDTKIYTGAAASGTALMSNTNLYDFTHPCASSICTGAQYITKSTTTTTLSDTGQQSQTVSVYADPSLGKISALKEWDYGTNFSGTPTRETDYTYTGFDVQQVTVKDGAGNAAGQTTYGYTSTAIATSGVTQHLTLNPGGPYLRTVSHWFSGGNPPVTTYAMDDTGMVSTVTDPKQNSAATSIYQCSNSLPYQVKNALNQTITYTHDCGSGALANVTDPNDSAASRAGTTYAYEAVAGRPLTVASADGGLTTYSYPSPKEMNTVVLATPSPSISSSDSLDLFGHPSQHTQGGVSSETTYDVNGRPHCSTNPHLPAAASSTDGSTCVTSYDGLDRPLTQTQPDGSALTWSYSGNTATSTDEVGNSRIRTTNAFGQLTSVTEPGNLTSGYSYDGLGNLSTITQSGRLGEVARARSFTYDTLSRMTTATSPEAGTIRYGDWNGSAYINGYDANGNLLRKTDARGVTTNYKYDGLNRLSAKTYTDSTPSSCFQYDASSVNGIGNLTSEWTQPGSCPASGGAPASALTKRIVTQYDSMGRATVEQQCPWGSCNSTNVPTLQYGFDLTGQRTSFTDAVNTTLTSAYDGAGRLSTLASSLWDGNHPQLVFAADHYGPMGLEKSRLGNGHYENRSYTNRGWLQSYTASHASNTQTGSAIVGVVDIVRNHGDGGNAVPQNAFIDVIGWAFNNAGCPLGSVEVDLDSTPIGLAGMNGSRSDVQQALGGGAQFSNCGWGITASVGGATPGIHTINVYGIDDSGNRSLLNNQYTITVSANTPPVGSEDGVVSLQDGTQTVLSGGLIYAYGWAIDSQMRAPVGAVKVLIDGSPIGFAPLGGNRPDIASAMNDQRYLHSGWNFVGSVGDLALGTHTVSAEIYDTGGTKIAPQTPRQITIVADPNTIVGDFTVNTIAGGLIFPRGSTLSVGGWVFESNSACATITRVEIWIDEKLQGTAHIGIPRQDVANAFQNQNCLNSGWNYSGAITGVDPGSHLVFVRAYDHSGGSVRLQQTPVIIVSGVMLPSTVSNPLATQYAFGLGYDPNGNIGYSSDSVNGTWAYLYDSLNRLSAAGSAYQTSFAWDYDSFGNMKSQVVTGGAGFQHDRSFNTSSNRTDQACYDASGNQQADWSCSPSGVQQYTYDAEGRMTSPNWGSTIYIYDAEGRRVAKQSGGQVTYLFYDNEGHQVLDMDGAGQSIRRQIYAGGRNVATYDDQQHTTIFAFSDWLGTQRARSDMTGTLCQTTTGQPFGDGPQVNGSCSPSNNSYTGLERDQESGLDHTQFRQYSSTNGRWMSPDPYSGSMDLSNPQSFNRYSYVGNMPLGFTDPTGLVTRGDPPSKGSSDSGDLGAAVATAGVTWAINKIASMFIHPQCSHCTTSRPNAQIWDEYHIHYGPNIAGALGLPSQACEFGACGSSFTGPNTSGAYPNGGDPTDLNLFGGFWDALSHTVNWAKVGCFATGFGGSLIDMGSNSPPGNADALRTARQGLKVATPRLMQVLRTSLAGSKAADSIPYVGWFLVVAQGTVAFGDGVTAVGDCKTK
jgi:RHS repeat-associated protein